MFSVHQRARATPRVALARAAALTCLALASPAFAVTYDFTVDPGWNEVNNRTGGQNYGWSNTDFTGTTVNPPGGAASGAGEIGGVIKRAGSPDNSYSASISLLTMNDAFHAKGVIHLAVRDGGSGYYLGFFDSSDYYNPGEGTPHNFLGFFFDDGSNTYTALAGPGGAQRINAPATLDLPTAVTVPFSLSYDPTIGSFGEMTVMVNGAFTTHVLDSTRGDVTFLDRFGLYAVSADGSSSEVYVDDLTIDLGTLVNNPTWANPSSGDWNVAANWVGGIPNAVGADAHFLGVIGSDQTVYTDAAVTVGLMEFDNSHTYVIAGTGSLTLDAAAGDAQISVLQGSHKINLPLLVNDNTVATVAAAAQLTIADPTTLVGGATLTKSGDGTMDIVAAITSASPSSLNTTAGTVNAHLDLGANITVNATGGTTNLHATQNLAAVNVGAGATVALTAGGAKVLVTKSASIAATGTVDLNDNDAVIDYTGPVGTLVADVPAHLLAGRLSSSLADASHKLGYGDNGVLNKASFSGITVDASSMLIKFTYAGDANLDGQVDIDDLAALATSWQTSAPWTGGDFDYSGFVDINDLASLATNWQAGVGAPLAMSFEQALASVGLGGVEVPEPSALALVGIAGAGLIRRRSRKARMAS